MEANARDVVADDRDRDRDRDADWKAFISDESGYGLAAPGRRDAALDHRHAQVGRTDSADDRDRLTEDAVVADKPDT